MAVGGDPMVVGDQLAPVEGSYVAEPCSFFSRVSETVLL